MLKVYKFLSNIIEPICPCYVGHYPTIEEKIYPYCEIKFPNILPNNSFSDNNLLQIDIWDDKDTDIREIEGITDSITKALYPFHYNDENMDLNIYKNSPYRLDLPDPIPNIQRRELRFNLKIYYK